MYFDWEKTASSTIYPKYGFYSPTNGVISTTSVFYAQQAKYLPRTDGLRTNVNESIYLTVSPSLADVLPSVSNPQSSYKNTVATNLVFDNWEPSDSPTPPVTFSNVNAQLQTLHNAGVSNLWVLLHTWQNRGYDNGYPDVLPAKPDWGGDPGLVNVSQTAANCGYLFGLHENYVDFYTNATSWNAADCALNTNGLLKLAWFNTVSNIQSYEMKPTLASNYASHFAWLIHSNYSTTSAFLDVHSSMNPSDKVDYDVTNAPGAGTFLETLNQYRNLFELLRTNHNGPVSGEGCNHMLYLGYIDDVEAQINSGSMIPHGTNNPQGWWAVAPQGQWLPLLVDFDLLKLHDKTVVHGVGYLERFYADTNNTGTNYTTYLKADVLEYMATELAYGHGGFIATPGRYNYFDGTNTYNTNAFVEVAQLEQRHVLPVQRLYANATPVSILYQNPNTTNDDEVSVSDYIRRYPTTFANYGYTNYNYMSQVRVTYDNGVVVCVNRHPSQQWQVQLGQPGGWFDLNVVKGLGVFQWTGYTNATSYTLPPANGWVVYVPAPLASP
jgi:hypothetical protein